jgi:DNA polymerase-3 subunit alpha
MNDVDKAQLLDLVRFKATKGAREAGYPLTKPYVDRMEYELSIIDKTGFATYFLIVADLCRFMRDRGIRYNPRGSGCGSVVVWFLRISHPWLDPVKYDIPFERFLNPDRVSNPDIDIDIDDERRHEVVAYTIEKYGADRVARIATFGTLGAKSAIMDIARALQIPDYQTVAAEISAHIPLGKGEDGKNWRLADVIARSEFLQEKERQYPDLFKYAKKAEGRVRHASIHAAGTIISPDTMTKYAPLLFQKSPENREASDWFPTTQWDMYDCEDRGLLKMDYLGLKTLRVIDYTVKMINMVRKIQGLPQDFDIDTVSQTDEATWKLLAEGKLLGIFQVERTFVQNFARRMNLAAVKDIWQLAVLVAIIRPGMMDTGMTEEYLLRASGQSNPEPPHPKLKELLQKNYGCFVMQEDLMGMAQILAGYTKPQADNLRRIIGKKKVADMAKEKPKFISAAVKNGVTDAEATHVWGLAEAFGRYGFNNSHALAYGIITYQTAYLKANYPLPFMANLINSESGVSDKDQGYNFKVAQYVEEARARGLQILPPSVKMSWGPCTIVEPFADTLRFGLSLIKRCSSGAVDWIVKHCREATNIKEFVLACYERRQVENLSVTDNHDNGMRLIEKKSEWRSYCQVGKTDLESLLAAGAFDVFDKDRPKLKVLIPAIAKLATKYHEQKCKVDNGSKVRLKPESLLEEINNFRLDDGDWPEVSLEQLIDEERQVTGCYLTTSPFAPFSEQIARYCNCTPQEVLSNEVVVEGPWVFAALVADYREIVVKQGKNKGKSMAIVSFRGIDGDVEAPAFCQAWEEKTPSAHPGGPAGLPLKTFVQRGRVYLVQVKPDMNGRGVVIENMWTLSKI